MTNSFLYTLSRRERITERSVFKSVLDSPEIKVVGKFSLMLACPNQLGFSRIGVIISKTSIPLAVNRNRIKRLVRESFRHKKKYFVCANIIAILRYKSGLITNQQLRMSIEKQFQYLIRKIQQHKSFYAHIENN